MYRIIFSINNNEEVWVMPHCPPDLSIPQAAKRHETYEGLSGDFRRIGKDELRHMDWTALLPNRRYPFMPPEASADGWSYVDFFERWQKRDVPFRIIILDSRGASRLNMPCTIDEFDPHVKQNGDIEYSISLTEYKFIG